MIELQRRDANAEIVLFRAVPELSHDVNGGYMELWYTGDSNWNGIRAEPDRLNYAAVVARGQGLPIGAIGFFGINLQDMFYDLRSYLVNGSILVNYRRKQHFGKVTPEHLRVHPPILVGERMPEQMLSIIAETRERVLETAGILHLPSRLTKKAHTSH